LHYLLVILIGLYRKQIFKPRDFVDWLIGKFVGGGVAGHPGGGDGCGFGDEEGSELYWI
jgi:hypothetical protein